MESPDRTHAAGRPAWLTRERMTAYAWIFAAVQTALFLFCVAGTHGLIVPMEHLPSTDFVSFYAAGALADAGTPSLVYDHAAHHVAEQAAVGAGAVYNYFYYPPVFLLICAPLALLPYLPAFILFQAIGAVACWFALRLIRRDLPLCVLLAFPGLWWAMGTGQNALLTAALFAAATAWVDRRPWLAGICFGALCYKPHFGLLIPVALIAGAYWRVVIAAALTALSLIAVSAAAFGVASWTAFTSAIASSADVYAAHAIFMGGLTSPYGVLMAAGAPRDGAFAVQAIVTLCAAFCVAWIWRSRAPLPIRAAVLLAATPVAVPVLMFYDLMLVLVALVWLSRVPETFASPWRIALAASVFLAPLLSGNLSSDAQWPFAFVTATLAFGLTVSLAWPAIAAPRMMAARPVTGAA